jgi:RpiB/LacA/LacB family sugar-phosphate isomerase
LLCGSGIGASIAANKIIGVRAAVCHYHFSARQGVEDDDMNILCLGGRTKGIAIAWDCVKSFLAAKFTGAERHLRRLGQSQRGSYQFDSLAGDSACRRCKRSLGPPRNLASKE